MSIKFNEVTWYSKLGAAILFLVIVPILLFYINREYRETQVFLKSISQITGTSNLPPVSNTAKGEMFSDPLNGTYTIGQEVITFVNGKSEQEVAPGSVMKMETNVFGVPVYGDINNDGQKDAVFFVSQETGGTGIFFYLVAAINQGGKYTGTTAVFLGDRIAPQNINITAEGIAVVNFAVRAPGEAMTTQPSMGRSRFFIVRNGQFVEGEQEWDVPEGQ
jgi:hypothetical protein